MGGQNQVFAYHFVLGYYGFFAGSIPYIVDGYGLTDPLLSRLYPDIRFDIVLGTFGMEPRAKPWRIGHFPRKLPEGYLESLKTGQNQITDTNLSQYYEHLKWAVRGNIWSKARFREIWRLNTGYYTDLIAPRLLFLRFQRQAAWHISNGQIEAASRELEQARNLRPKHFENLFWLACIYQHLDQKDQALEALHQVLKADPSFLPAVFNKTLILVQTGQITQALADFKTMIRKQPDALSTLRYLIPKLTELGQDKAANLFYQEALIINPALRLE